MTFGTQGPFTLVKDPRSLKGLPLQLAGELQSEELMQIWKECSIVCRRHYVGFTANHKKDNADSSPAFEDEDIPEAEDLSQFYGLDFDAWLYVFMQYAICLTKHEDPQDAYDVLSTAKEANVFFHDEKKKFIVHATHLGNVTRTECMISTHN